MVFDGRDTQTLTISIYSSPSFNITRYFSLFMKISCNFNRWDGKKCKFWFFFKYFYIYRKIKTCIFWCPLSKRRTCILRGLQLAWMYVCSMPTSTKFQRGKKMAFFSYREFCHAVCILRDFVNCVKHWDC